jgi:antitoxin (DNA-binding transcriptional repressor) of toxin-antitoxin stability system
MLRINIHDAKTHLSRYLEQVEKGEVITICRNNVPIAELRAVAVKPKGKRRIGLFKGQFEITPAFFEPMSEEELDLWYGRGK